MIYLERTVVIENSTAYIEEPIYLYKGDKNIEIRFAIENNPFKYKNDLTMNYGQLIIKRKSAPNIFSEVTKLSGGRIILTITGEMIDELSELGSYTFQIRLFNADMTSRGTLPPVENGIVIVEPLCEEPLEPVEPPKVYVNPDFYEVRTSGGTNYNYLFYNYTGTELDLSAWDTGNVTNMGSMFRDCNNLTELDLSSFNTSNVTNMREMFYNCQSLTSLDVSGFNTSKATDMNSMFYNCQSLTELDVSNFNTCNVTNISATFAGCYSLTELDLSKFDTSNVTTMNSMFYNCSKLTSLDVSNFDTSNVTNMGYMFNGCSKLHILRLDNCSNDTINKIITSSGFPTNAITTGVTRKIYCKEANAAGLTAPKNWIFEYID